MAEAPIVHHALLALLRGPWPCPLAASPPHCARTCLVTAEFNKVHLRVTVLSRPLGVGALPESLARPRDSAHLPTPCPAEGL